ncbi:hypothetical protein VNO78_03463 [Psophocarpus tetragonolobus]|uniref:Uncharacterized protein n=1 Tax=Psophocarpus tetragonolobus TaxID=3891 RepID=A0AAN9T0F4_PSOTE
MANPTVSFALLCLLAFAFAFVFVVVVEADSHFEGFEGDEDDDLEDTSIDPASLRTAPLSDPTPTPTPSPSPAPEPDRPKGSAFDLWDEEEFEGVPVEQAAPEAPKSQENTTGSERPQSAKGRESLRVEMVCGSFLVMFAINYFSGKRENEKIALSWVAQFAGKESIFEKNFSLLGMGEGDEAPLLLKEGQTTFKFYASGRRYCQGVLATLELKSRHDLIARIYNMIVPSSSRDHISFEVYMNDDSMDHVVFALAKKKPAKSMHKDLPDLHRFATLLSPPSSRKWLSDHLSLLSESKELAYDFITDAVIDQVFGDKAFEKFGKGLISLHFSDQHPGIHKKVLLFKFVLPAAKNMADMTRLVALVPYYIDLIGRYKLSSQARSKTEAARQKVALEAQKEIRNAQQEAMQRRKAEKKKMMEEAEAKLSAEAIRKKEAKERARQMKKAMPRMKMARGA